MHLLIFNVNVNRVAPRKANTDYMVFDLSECNRLKGLVCGLTSQSTAMIMWRQSVNLTKLFWGKLRPCS